MSGFFLFALFVAAVKILEATIKAAPKKESKDETQVSSLEQKMSAFEADIEKKLAAFQADMSKSRTGNARP